MKVPLISIVIAATLLCANAAQASPEMAKAACGRCHDAEQKKSGPTYKAIAAEYNGDEQAVLTAINDPKNEHPRVRAKEDDVKAIVKWVVTQK